MFYKILIYHILHIFILYHGLGQMFLKLSMADQPPPHGKASTNIEKSIIQTLSKLSFEALLVLAHLFFIDATYLMIKFGKMQRSKQCYHVPTGGAETPSAPTFSTPAHIQLSTYCN